MVDKKSRFNRKQVGKFRPSRVWSIFSVNEKILTTLYVHYLVKYYVFENKHLLV